MKLGGVQLNLKELLNSEQYEAATHIEGPLLILAGAGSGKTRVLTYRIAHMIKDKDIFPYNILAITFTNKAAGEMRERVKKLIGDRAEGMWISTFHSSCVRILRREAEHMGFNTNFTIYDSYDSKALVKQCMKEIGIDEKDITEKEIIGTISNSKNELMTAVDFKKKNESNFRVKASHKQSQKVQKHLIRTDGSDRRRHPTGRGTLGCGRGPGPDEFGSAAILGALKALKRYGSRRTRQGNARFQKSQRLARGAIGGSDMRNDTGFTEAGQRYAAAYAAHYTTKDLHEAIDLYKGIMAAHPNTKEAEYSRTQILNIVQSVVPKQRHLDAQVELALTCLRSQS